MLGVLWKEIKAMALAIAFFDMLHYTEYIFSENIFSMGMAMFIGREKELDILKRQLDNKGKAAVLIYGKRRVGKTTLIAEAAKSFNGKLISYMCVQSTLEGNLDLMSKTISVVLGIPEIKFQSLKDIFDYLGHQNESFLFVIDEICERGIPAPIARRSDRVQRHAGAGRVGQKTQAQRLK